MFKKKFWTRLKSKRELIFESPFLKSLSRLERYEFLSLSHHRRYKSGEFVYHQGDPATGLYLIEKGNVELVHFPAPDKDPLVLTQLSSPDCFGAFSIDYMVRRKASARCISDTSLYGFFLSDYQTLSKRHPRAALRFIETLNTITIQHYDLVQSRFAEGSLQMEECILFSETYDLPDGESVKEKIS